MEHTFTVHIHIYEMKHVASKFFISHIDFGLTPLSGDRRGYMPPLLKVT